MAGVKEIRARLQRLDDVHIDALAIDDFPAIYGMFSATMRRDQKINLIISTCMNDPQELARLARVLGIQESIEAAPPHTPVDDGEPTARVVGSAAGRASRPVSQIRSRYALLIGVRDYIDHSYATLPSTVVDVTELEKVLKSQNYTVKSLHSGQQEAALRPTRDNIWGELENIARSTSAGDLLLVHFGGHGLYQNGKAYLLPETARAAAIERTAILLEEFTQTIANAGAQARILFLDACHSGIGRDSNGMSPEFEQRVLLEAEGMAVLASCRQGQVAYNHNQCEHGVFTYYLLEGLKGQACKQGTRYVTFDSLKDYTTDQVKKWAIQRGLQQWPNATTAIAGDAPLAEIG